MTAAEVYHRARQLGFQIEPRPGGKLAVIPGDNVPPDLLDAVKAHKAALLAWLNRPPCPGWQSVPPPDLPLNPAMPRPTAQDRERVIAYLRRQTGDRPGPLAAWLVRRECLCYDGPGRSWDCALFAYAAARDCACWQLGCNERGLWGRLAGFDELADSMKTPRT